VCGGRWKSAHGGYAASQETVNNERSRVKRRIVAKTRMPQGSQGGLPGGTFTGRTGPKNKGKKPRESYKFGENEKKKSKR